MFTIDRISDFLWTVFNLFVILVVQLPKCFPSQTIARIARLPITGESRLLHDLFAVTEGTGRTITKINKEDQ